MPISQPDRIVSDSNIVVASDRDTAVSLLLAGEAGNVTIVPPNPLWPSLNEYNNDNSPLGPTAEPQYIWDSTTSDGQSRGFAGKGLGLDVIVPIQLLVTLTVFTDNAHEAQIDIFDISGPNPVLAETITPTPQKLLDGNLDPVTGTTTDVSHPFNWQKIRYYSNFSSILPASAYQMVVSFRVVNYNISPPGAPNPAALAFVSDCYPIT
jgi:hypothetical protein